jgi:transposase-like protein
MTEDGNKKIGVASKVGRLVSREELIAGYKEDGRTVYRQAGKAKLVAAARQVGVSVARLAREHDLNANQLHAWIRQSLRHGARAGKAAKVAAGMEKAAQTRTKTSNGVGVATATATAATTATTPTPTLAKLLPVTLTPASVPPTSPPTLPLPAPARSMLVIEIGGARIHIEGDVDKTALATVIASLQSVPPLSAS